MSLVGEARFMIEKVTKNLIREKWFRPSSQRVEKTFIICVEIDKKVNSKFKVIQGMTGSRKSGSRRADLVVIVGNRLRTFLQSSKLKFSFSDMSRRFGSKWIGKVRLDLMKGRAIKNLSKNKLREGGINGRDNQLVL